MLHVFLFRNKIPAHWLLPWFASVAVCIGLTWLMANFAQLAKEDEVRQRRMAYLPVLLLLSGVSRGCVVLLPGATHDGELYLIHLFILAITSLMAIHVLGINRRALMAFTFGMGLPVLWLYAVRGHSPQAVGVSVIVLIGLEQLYGRTARNFIKDRMRAHFSLEIATARLDVRNAELAAALHTISELARHDSLTGCLNRRAGLEKMESETSRYQRQAVNFGIILADIDHFKVVNDTYGHPAGDTVLVAFSQRIQAQLRDLDSLIRWGGEEFLCIISNCDATTLRDKAQFLCDHVAASPMKAGDKQLSVTASFGVALCSAEDTIATMIERSDMALYRAKHTGRNRVC